MITNSQPWYNIEAPAGWNSVVIRAVAAAVIAFVTLQLKEYIDAGSFDTPATAIDGGLIAGATFVVNAILMMTKPSPVMDENVE
jgi:hypothetical protein